MKIQQKITAETVIGLVPDKLLDQLSTETMVDYSVKKLHGKVIFQLFVYGVLSGKRISLRILEAIFNSEKFKKVFHLPTEWIKHSGIGKRLATINYKYFERIFQWLIELEHNNVIKFGDSKSMAVSKFDSTIVTLSSKLMKVGLDNNPGHKTIKYGVELRYGIPVNILLFEKQKELSEDEALPRLIKENKQKNAVNISIFDRGIQRRQTFVDLTEERIYFISRLTTQKYQVVTELPITEKSTSTLTIISDQIIRFANEKETIKQEFRLVVDRNKTTKQLISFITNIDFFKAHEITQLYKSRWEIETFFKFIKQELNFSHILSRTENGIKVVMYLTMITAILLTIYKRMNKIIGWTVAKIKFLDELESKLMHYWHPEIASVFDPQNPQFYANYSGP